MACCYHGAMRTPCHVLPGPRRAAFRASGLLAPALLASVLLALAGCNPTYNWREHASQDGRYKVLFPAKPASVTRPVDVGGLRVEMTMTAAEVDGATFAVGSATAPDAARARAALPAMRTALLRNIGVDDAPPAGPADGLQVDARGINANMGGGKPVHLRGRFEARGARFYQVIVLGPADATPPEQVEQFLTSFAPW